MQTAHGARDHNKAHLLSRLCLHSSSPTMHHFTTICLALALACCLRGATATVQLRVTVDCPRTRTITGMAENPKVWESFDDNLNDVIVNDCNVRNPGLFFASTVSAESATTFLFYVAQAKNFRAFRKCVNQNSLMVKRCTLVAVCRTDKDDCEAPTTTVTTTATTTVTTTTSTTSTTTTTTTTTSATATADAVAPTTSCVKP
eukprot:m.271654 g.271654  ORF g.271654 m.271654 type:complete len:202 (+) comp15683_c14_seq3:2829-3434(+)